jgi:hypothetical protein
MTYRLKVVFDPEIGFPPPELRDYVVEWVLDAKKRGLGEMAHHQFCGSNGVDYRAAYGPSDDGIQDIHVTVMLERNAPPWKRAR